MKENSGTVKPIAMLDRFPYSINLPIILQQFATSTKIS